MKKILKKMVTGVCMLSMVISTNVLGVHAAEIEIEIRTTSQPFASGEEMLNCYTSQSVPASGTKVSTWSRTGNDTQLWVMVNESNGRKSIRSRANKSVALNANRTSVGTTVNVLNVSGNNILDYTFTSIPSEYALGRFTMAARYNQTSKVCITNNGSKAFCTWQYSSSSLNQKWAWSEL